MATFDWNIHKNMGHLEIPPLLPWLTDPEQARKAAGVVRAPHHSWEWLHREAGAPVTFLDDHDPELLG